ncbi:uncharacterized protein N7459_002381 [Penicillium hispanicum]|uniref:uncharacterized protein n=1 Tax=Penicillium hispanicum TaxID=1080232 RepID=UPI00253FD2F4|nr:uncharacterized protein N7459_002381 [Penicillium hispanicum]KAJ5592012.1 hypothetical protein N7459_002381 [Penicillium hispanicum]
MPLSVPGEDSGARRKRPGGKYTSRACEECRRRRAKCDGDRPSCSRCLDRGINCQYSKAEDGRQPAPKSYVVMLRNRIELLERVLLSHGIDVDASIAQLMTENGTPPQATDLSSADGCSPNMDDLCMTFEGALTIDESLNFDQDGEVRYFGPTSGRLLFRSSLNDSLSEEGRLIETLCTSNYPHAAEHPIAAPMDCGEYQVTPDEAFISEELQSHLINLYFEWEQPWFQVVNEKLFRDSLAYNGRYSSSLLLNCILAIGSRYCERIEVRAEPNDSNTAGKIFIQRAEELIQRDLRWPKITTIQSLAIMGMFYIATGSDAAGWLHQGMANRLALDMGLNMDPAVLPGTVSLPTIEIELRRQIYWALYCHDKLSASYTGRDSQGAVHKPYYQCASDACLPSANGQLRAASQMDVVQLHRAMIDLCRILEKILLSLWSPKPLLHASQRSAFFDSCVLKLKTWYYDLPSALKIDRVSGPSRFPHAYTLLMVYHIANMLLCGPFLAKPIPPEGDGNGNGIQEKQDDETHGEHSCAEKAIQTCSASVRAMLIIAQKYRRVFGSFKLSPITATYCTLSTALIVIERCCAENDRAKNSPNDQTPRQFFPHAAVALLFQVLRELSTSWNIAKRIGRNLEKVYFQRYGYEHLPPPSQLDGSAHEAPHQQACSKVTAESTASQALDHVFTSSDMLFENPLSLQLGDPVAIHPPVNLNRPDMAFLSAQPGNFHIFPNYDELFVNNLGLAFSPDSLPSDYNMFDPLNHMYLEEQW